MNCKVQLIMVAWQTDRGTLSWLSERGNCGTWERSSASECVSECASAPSTQSQKFSHFCECNVNCKYVKYDFSTNEARNNCNTSFPCDFDWAIHFWYYFHDSSRSKGKFQTQTRNMCRPNTSFSYDLKIHLWYFYGHSKSYSRSKGQLQGLLCVILTE